jgi:glycosyltransferase involved in cell wall biosynthesis
MASSIPPISVLLAVYNGGRYLRAAVDSILTQTLADFEFIIIDDGSTDGSSAVLAEYAAKDSRIRLVSRPNKGLTATLNEGLALARGEFLARMDADDTALPPRFERQIAYLREHPECVLVGSRVMLVDPEGLPIRPWCHQLEHTEIDAAHLNRGWPVVHPAVMMRTDAVRKVGAYRDQYNTLEDLDLFLRLAEVGKLANLPEILLHYRQHFDSVTHKKFEQQRKLRRAIYDEAYARRGQQRGDTSDPPAPPPRKRYEQHSLWAWYALDAGNVRTARKHALATLRRAPYSLNAWRLMACALRGR